MSPRLSRAEQNDRNRVLLLTAARRVFLDRGYYAATLEQIVNPDAFGGSGLPALHRLGDWFTGQQMPTQEGQ